MISDLVFPAQLPDCEIAYHPGFLDPDAARDLLDRLSGQTPWRQDSIRLFGKTHPQPRLTALYATNGRPYAYSGITMHPDPFPGGLDALRLRVQAHCGSEFSTCLLNYYRDGRDSNGWHADDEPELGRNPVIASLSLGEPRFFHMKHRTRPGLRYRLLLEPGSLLVMAGPTQHHWLHQIPKSRKTMGPRINLTFRKIPG